MADSMTLYSNLFRIKKKKLTVRESGSLTGDSHNNIITQVLDLASIDTDIKNNMLQG